MNVLIRNRYVCLRLIDLATGMHMATVCDTGMLFVPCRDGRSHTPEEYVSPQEMANGIAVLANALVKLSQ